MDDVFRMYAMSDGNPNREPGDLDQGQVEPLEEEDELETAGILTSSDDDEVIAEEVIIVAEPMAPKKKAPAKKAAKKAPAKKAAAKKPAAKKAAKKSRQESACQEGREEEGSGKEGSQKGSEEGSGEEGRKEKGSSKEGSQEGREESQEDREEGQEEVGADCRRVSGRQDGEYSGQDQGARQIAGLLAVCQGNPVLPRSSRISRWSVFGLTICGQWNRLGSPTHCAEDAQWTGHGRLQ